LIRVRFKQRPFETILTKSQNIAGEKDVYRLLAPASGLASNIIDRIWDAYEPDLPAAITAFENGTWGDDQWATILFHIYAQGVRHPEFASYAAKHLAAQGDPSDHDAAQQARVTTLAALPHALARWKFAVIHRSDEGPRFLVNDKGYASVQEDEARKATLFPLSGNVAILGAVDASDSRSETHPPELERTLTPGSVESFNDASWQVPEIRCVIGHPDQEDELLRISDDIPLRQNRLGPFRRNREGLLDWAFGTSL
jgi:hypothetical protein